MGEVIEQQKTMLAQASEDAMVVDTTGGRIHLRWDESAQATPHGQIAFFAEFLATARDREDMADVAGYVRNQRTSCLNDDGIRHDA